MISILRRRGLGNGSTRAIKKNLYNDGIEIDIIRYDNRGISQLTRHGAYIYGPVNDNPFAHRWGYTGEAGYDRDHTINLSEHIHLVNNKPECRKKLILNGINVPMTFYSKEDIAIADFPVVGRPSRHAQGRKMVISRNHDELRRDISSTYWSKIIDKDQEFRVFTFFGKITMVAEKVPTEIGRRRIAWNHFGGGATFENVTWGNWPIEACKEALKASNVIGIDFAGVDVMMKDGVPYILEINSAHSLTSEYRQKTFSKALKWLINELEVNNAKPAHFEYPTHIRTYKSMILPYLRNA